MVIHASVVVLGATNGRPGIIARELDHGELVPLSAHQAEVSTRSCLVTPHAARRRPEVQAFRGWILAEAAEGRSPAAVSAG